MPEITGLPGYRSDRSAAYRRIRKSDNGVRYYEGGIPIDGTYSGDAGNTGNVDVLRAGKIMVKKNTGGLWRNFIIGKTTAAYVDNDTTLTVGAATATEVARLIVATGGSVSLSLIGPPSAAGTVAATAITVSAASGTTLTISDLNLAKVTDSLIALPAAAYTDGTFGFIDDGTGIKCSDEDGVRLNVPCPLMLVGGSIDESQIIDLPADTSTVTYLKGLLNSAANGYGFRFDGPVVA